MYPLDQLIYDLLIAVQLRKKRVQLSPLCKELTMVFISTREMHVTCYAGCTQWNLEINKKMKRLKRHRKVTNITNSNIKPLPTSTQC